MRSEPLQVRVGWGVNRQPEVSGFALNPRLSRIIPSEFVILLRFTSLLSVWTVSKLTPPSLRDSML